MPRTPGEWSTAHSMVDRSATLETQEAALTYGKSRLVDMRAKLVTPR